MIDKLQDAKGGSRELDSDIHSLVSPDRKHPYLTGVHIDDTHPSGRPYDAPPYTTSIDAALTLVPDGWSWSLGEMRGIGKFRAWLNDHNTPDGLAVRHVDYDAETPALALCIAALKAKDNGHG